MTTQQIKLIERQIKSYLTIGKPSSKGFIYTRELIEDVLKQQQSLINDKSLFVTLGYTGDNIIDSDFDKVEGFVTKAEITEDNKVTYTIQFLEKVANLYLSIHVPMLVEIPIKAKIDTKNNTITEIEATNYIDMVFKNPKETFDKFSKAIEQMKILVDSIKGEANEIK